MAKPRPGEDPVCESVPETVPVVELPIHQVALDQVHMGAADGAVAAPRVAGLHQNPSLGGGGIKSKHFRVVLVSHDSQSCLLLKQTLVLQGLRPKGLSRHFLSCLVLF